MLLAEDHAVNRKLVTTILKKRGHNVEAVEHGGAAIQALETARSPFDVVIMDLQMPEMGGLEATRLVRALPGWGDRPILAMTANVVAEDLRYCEAAGMNTVVTKPIDPRALYAALLKWLPQRGARQHTPTPTGNPHHD